MNVGPRTIEPAAARRRVAVLLLTLLAACTSKGSATSGSGGNGGVGTATGGSGGAARGKTGGTGGGPVDAGAADVLTLAGPCGEGMECNGNDPGGSPQFHCVCAAGRWVCPTHDSKGYLTGALPLPSADPQNGASCPGTNYACTLPDRCGGLCLCNQVGKWTCKTLVGDADGGAITEDGTVDASSSNTSAGGCAWPPCSGYGATPPATAKCFTPVCFSTVHPSGDTFFAAGPGGCSVEH